MSERDELAVVPEDVAAVGRFAYRVVTELCDGADSLDSEVKLGITAENYRTQDDDSAVSLSLLNLEVPQ